MRRSTKIKYFACGEYGENTGRPHYHTIIFGNDYARHKEHYKHPDWEYGNIYVGEVTKESARYVCDYIFKAYDGELGEEYYRGYTKPFRLLSKGIGRRYIEDHYKAIIQHGYMTNKGRKESVPRYYLKKMDITAIGLKELARTFKYVPEDVIVESENQNYLPLANRLQNERTLISRHRLKGSSL